MNGKRVLLSGLLLAVTAPAFGVSVWWTKTYDLNEKWTAAARIARFKDGPVAALADRTLSGLVGSEMRAFLRQARKETPNPGYPMAPWGYGADTVASLARPDLVSAYVETYDFRGGAHGMTTYIGVNVGLVSGQATVLRLEDLFRPGVPARALAVDAVKERLRATPRAAWFQPGVDPAYLPSDADLIKDFVITPSGITFLIEPYVAGPYAVGSFFVKVPFAAFSGKLNPKGPLQDLL